MSIALEKSILVTYLYADLQLTDNESSIVQAHELKEEYFQEHYFKLIVKTINHLKEQGKPFYLEYVAEVMQEQGIFNEVAFTDIITTNQLTAKSFSEYFLDFSSNGMKHYQGDI